MFCSLCVCWNVFMSDGLCSSLSSPCYRVLGVRWLFIIWFESRLIRWQFKRFCSRIRSVQKYRSTKYDDWLVCHMWVNVWLFGKHGWTDEVDYDVRNMDVFFSIFNLDSLSLTNVRFSGETVKFNSVTKSLIKHVLFLTGMIHKHTQNKCRLMRLHYNSTEAESGHRSSYFICFNGVISS